MGQQKRYYWLIERRHLQDAVRGCGIDGLLDMLRYDRAVIECNAPEGFWMLSAERPPTLARWKSFGIIITAESSSRLELDNFVRKQFVNPQGGTPT